MNPVLSTTVQPHPLFVHVSKLPGEGESNWMKFLYSFSKGLRTYYKSNSHDWLPDKYQVTFYLYLSLTLFLTDKKVDYFVWSTDISWCYIFLLLFLLIYLYSLSLLYVCGNYIKSWPELALKIICNGVSKSLVFKHIDHTWKKYIILLEAILPILNSSLNPSTCTSAVCWRLGWSSCWQEVILVLTHIHAWFQVVSTPLPRCKINVDSLHSKPYMYVAYTRI